MPQPLKMPTTPQETYSNYATWSTALHIENTLGMKEYLLSLGKEENFSWDANTLRMQIPAILLYWTLGLQETVPLFAQLLISDWLSNMPSWLNWPTLLSIIDSPIDSTYQDTHDLYMQLDTWHQDIAVILVDAAWRTVVTRVEHKMEKQEALLALVRDILSPYQEQQGLWKSKDQTTWKVCHIISDYIQAINWEEVYQAFILE